MTAFVPISPAAARQILGGISEVDDCMFLSAFVEAGRVRAYADVIETVAWNDDRTEVLDGRISPYLWRRIVAEGKLAEVLASSSTRLDGDGLVGGQPAVMITGLRFNADNVRKIASRHSVAASHINPPPVAKLKIAKAAVATKPIEPERPGSMADAPHPVEAIATPTPKPARSVARVGLPDDALCVTLPEAESILRVSRSQVYRMFESGLLEKVKVGGRSLVKADGIRKLFDG